MPVSLDDPKAQDEIEQTISAEKNALEKKREQKKNPWWDTYIGVHGEGPGVIPDEVWNKLGQDDEDG